MEKSYQIALLIDAENINVKYVNAVIKEISKYGKLVISRFYGDIQKLSNTWNLTALDYAIKPMHQYNVATKKNAADMAMALDALEIMYQGKVDAFFIVSSDSDFTPLSSKLREGGMYVIGVGKEEQVTNAFKSSCNEFKYFDYLMDETAEEAKTKNVKTEKTNTSEEEINEIIKDVIIESGVNNKIAMSQLGIMLINRFSDFDPRKYGAKQLSDLVSTIPELTTSKENKTIYVELESVITKKQVSETIYEIISRNQSKKMKLSKLINEITKVHHDFDYKTYGFTKFSRFLSSIKDLKVYQGNVTLK